jgi:hypothetical protein
MPTDAGGITLGVSESATAAQQRLRRAWLAA